MKSKIAKLSSSLLFTAICAAPPALCIAESPELSQRFAIGAQPLASALRQYADQAGEQVVFFSEIGKDQLSADVVGEFTRDQALKKILSNTGLTFERLNAKTIAITPVKESTSMSSEHGGWRDGGRADRPGLMWLAQADSSETASGETGRMAQQESAAGQSSESLEEIVVTARKVSERLQDVPISMTAFTGEQLRNRGAVDLKDVLRTVPGLSFSNIDRGQSKYTIRGVANSVTAPTVGLYLDDIALMTNPSNYTGAFDPVFFDMERLEVLKGPQGTLYGGSAMGGAIKYVSARPDLSEFSSSVGAGVATQAHGDPTYNAEGILNVPLVPGVLAIRGGVFYRHEGGYVDNVANADVEDRARSSTPFPDYTPLTQPSLNAQTRHDYNSGDTYAARLSLLWRPDESLSIRPAVFYQDYKLDNPGYIFDNLGTLTSSYRFLEQQTHDRGGIYSLEVIKKWASMDLTSVTAYFDRKLTWERDFSFFIGGPILPSLYPFNSFAHYPYHTKTFSQELRISSAAGTDTRLRWVAGLYYSNQDQTFSPATISTFGIGLPDDLLTFLDQQLEVEQSAAFGEVTLRITEALDLTAGARAFKSKQAVTTTTGGIIPPGTTAFAADEDGINPKVGLSYRVAEDHLLYASAAKGYRPGGAVEITVFPPSCDAGLAQLGYSSPPTSYESDNLWTYELGSKNEFGGRRFMVNGSVFQTDWKEIQQFVSPPGCTGFGFNANVGSARIRGAELETQISVTSALRLGANATYSDAKIVGSVPGLPAQPGDEIQDVPQWMASVYGSYSIPLNARWDLEARADYQYRDKQRNVFGATQGVSFADGGTGAVPNAAEFQGGYELVNAFLSLSDGTTSVRLFVNNLLDARPYLDTNVGFGVSRSNTLRPRTIGMELRRQF